MRRRPARGPARLTEFGLLGVSGGGPYALAVAAGLPQRVDRVAVLSCGGPFEIAGAFDGMARPNRMMWSAIARRPGVARFMLGQQAKLVNIAAMPAWGDRWLTGPEGSPLTLRHQSCGHDIAAVVVCSECAEPLDVGDVVAHYGPGHPDRQAPPA